MVWKIIKQYSIVVILTLVLTINCDSNLLAQIPFFSTPNVNNIDLPVRLLIKTQPSQHWSIGREFRLRVKQALDKEGIGLGIPQREIWHHNK